MRQILTAALLIACLASTACSSIPKPAPSATFSNQPDVIGDLIDKYT